MSEQKLTQSPGQSSGEENGLGLISIEKLDIPPKEGTTRDQIRVSFPEPILLSSYAWTTTLSELYVDLATIDEFWFSCLFHFVVDTPVHAATDHDWQDDVVLVFELFTATGAYITSFNDTFRRDCGRYLREIPGQRFASQVAWPIRNAASVRLGGTFRLRVTAC